MGLTCDVAHVAYTYRGRLTHGACKADACCGLVLVPFLVMVVGLLAGRHTSIEVMEIRGLTASVACGLSLSKCVRLDR